MAGIADEVPARRQWPINEVARMAGTTSRTLRHYGDLGLLEPASVGANGYRYYDQDGLLRLSRILLLRQMGMGLEQIGVLLAHDTDPVLALQRHLLALQAAQERLGRQVTAVTKTIDRLRRGEDLMAEDILAGFDNSQYEEEVVQRWGQDAWQSSNRTWARLGPDAQRRHLQEGGDIAQAMALLLDEGAPVEDPRVQALAARQHAWVALFWTPDRAAFIGLAQVYVDDPRFAANYEQVRVGLAAYLRDAMVSYAQANLQ